jgi:DNA repair exonuclease SbcCD ATPase subunit
LLAAKLQHAQLQAQEAQLQLERAQREVDSAQLQVARAESALQLQFTRQGAQFGVVELHALRAAIHALRARGAQCEDERRAAQRQVDERRDAVAAVDSTVRTLERDIQRLRVRSLRAADNKALELAEDLWTARRRAT